MKSLSPRSDSIMETDLKEIERISKLKDHENWEFRAFLKSYDIPLEELDSTVHELKEKLRDDFIPDYFDDFLDFED